jgi:hypothetical protein
MTGGRFDYGLYYGHSADHSDDIVYSCAGAQDDEH